MPRNVRNFWIELQVDGSKEKIATGPRASDGGFQLGIGMREEGGISNHTIQIEGSIEPTGSISLTVYHMDGRKIVDKLEDIVLDR